MSLKIALIDSDPERAKALEGQLHGFADVIRVRSGSDFAKIVADAAPDLVIVDMALPDRDTLEDLRAVAGSHPVVMFAGGGDPGFAEAAIEAGVCSYNLSGAAVSDIKPIVMSAIALFRRYRRVEVELEETKSRLEERRIIERAKSILMRDRRMTEPEAYAWLRRKAMNENRKISVVAAALIKKEEGNDAKS